MAIDKQKLKKHLPEIFFILSAGFAVCFLFSIGISLVFLYTEEYSVGVGTIIMGFVLSTSMICYMNKKKGEEDN